MQYEENENAIVNTEPTDVNTETNPEDVLQSGESGINPIVNTTPTTSETPSNLVADDEAGKLSPNPAGFGFTKQVTVSSLSSPGSPDTLYLVPQYDGEGHVKECYKYKWNAGAYAFERVFEPVNNVAYKDGEHATPVVENNPPKEAPEKVFTGEVVFNQEPTIEGKKLHDWVDSEGGVTQEELDAALAEKQDKLDSTSAPAGVVVKLIGFDSQGHVVNDDVPEGIVVDDALDNESTNAISNKAVSDTFAAAYDSSETYNVNDFVIYEGGLYKCKANDVTGAWDSSKWTAYVVGEELKELEDKKVNVDANVPTLTAGLALNLDTKIVDNDVNAFLFRPTGGLDTECGNNCKVKGIVGGSIGFNQKVNNGNFASTSGWYTNKCSVSVSNNIATLTVTATDQTPEIFRNVGETINGHKFLTLLDFKVSHEYAVSATIAKSDWSSYVPLGGKYPTAQNTWTKYEKVTNVNFTGNSTVLHIYPFGSNYQIGDTCQIKNVQIIDLTAMFGTTIADYIYTLETGTPGAGVAWFKRYFNKSYYSYTAIGGFIHVKTSGVEAVGFNQCSSFLSREESTQYYACLYADFELEEDTYYCVSFEYATGHRFYSNENVFDVSTVSWGDTADGKKYFVAKTLKNVDRGQYVNGSGWLVLKNSSGNTVTPNFQDVCVNYHYDGERDGEFEPFHKETYENDNIELIGIPHIDDQGNLYYEGNVYRPDGTVEEGYAEITLNGTESWSGSAGWGQYSFAVQNKAPGCPSGFDTKDTTNSLGFNNTTAANVVNAGVYPDTFKVGVGNGSWVYVNVPGCTTQAEVQAYFTEHPMKLIYKLATPTTSSASSYPETQWRDNWGTEKRIDTRDVPVPVGHDTDYPLDLKSKLEIAPNSPANDGDYILHAESGTNTYTPLNTWLSNNGYAKANTLPTIDSVGGTLRQLLAVKETLDFEDTDYVDLGTLDYGTSYGTSLFNATLSVTPAAQTIKLLNTLGYKPKGSWSDFENTDLSIYVSAGGVLFIHNNSYTSADAFKAAMKGVLLAYEKASS